MAIKAIGYKTCHSYMCQYVEPYLSVCAILLLSTLNAVFLKLRFLQILEYSGPTGPEFLNQIV
jgi:hypothetical protein